MFRLDREPCGWQDCHNLQLGIGLADLGGAMLPSPSLDSKPHREVSPDAACLRSKTLLRGGLQGIRSNNHRFLLGRSQPKSGNAGWPTYFCQGFAEESVFFGCCLANPWQLGSHVEPKVWPTGPLQWSHVWPIWLG